MKLSISGDILILSYFRVQRIRFTNLSAPERIYAYIKVFMLILCEMLKIA